MKLRRLGAAMLFGASTMASPSAVSADHLDGFKWRTFSSGGYTNHRVGNVWREPIQGIDVADEDLQAVAQ